MTIAEIYTVNADKKHRRVVLVDDEGQRETVFVPAYYLKERELDVGSTVDLDSFRADVAKAEMRLAEEISYRKLTVSAKSEREITRTLRQNRIPADAIEGTLEKLKRYSFVNDEAYVREFVSFAKKKFGRARIEYVLTSEKGVDSALVKELLPELITREEEYETALTIATKYATPRVLSGKNPREKIYAYLSTRGFNGDICAETSRKIVGGDED